MREHGELQSVVEQSIDCLEAMFSGSVDLLAMSRASRDFHANRFSLEAHNESLRQIYAAVLKGTTPPLVPLPACASSL
jgi:hypothetical protein